MYIQKNENRWEGHGSSWRQKYFYVACPKKKKKENRFYRRMRLEMNICRVINYFYLLMFLFSKENWPRSNLMSLSEHTQKCSEYGDSYSQILISLSLNFLYGRDENKRTAKGQLRVQGSLTKIIIFYWVWLIQSEEEMRFFFVCRFSIVLWLKIYSALRIRNFFMLSSRLISQ